MKLTVNCQICGKILTVVENTNFTDADISMYQQNSSCSTIQSESVDAEGNLIVVLDAQQNIQVTKTTN